MTDRTATDDIVIVAAARTPQAWKRSIIAAPPGSFATSYPTAGCVFTGKIWLFTRNAPMPRR